MALYRDHGVVLRTIKLGESDRIVTFVTAEHGKVRAVAKGARKITSRFGGRLEPTCHVSLLLYEGRELDVVSQAETVDAFGPVRGDLDRLGRALTLLEAVDGVAQERQADPRLYQMLVGALRSLAARDAAVLVGAFFLKLLDHEGVRPELDACIECGATEALVAFDPDGGGVRCRSCRRGAPLSPEALDLARRILGGDLAAALGTPRGPATVELEAHATRCLEYLLDRRLRSVGVLER